MLERRETAGLGVEMRKIEAPAELLLAAVLAHEAVQPALKTACQPEIVTVDGEDQSVVEDRAVEPVGDYEFESERSAAVIGALLPFVDPGEAVHPPLRGLADRGRDRGGLKSVEGGLQPVVIAQRRSEERRVGKECVSTGRCRGAPDQ